MAEPATAAYDRQTAIVDSLPHACTMARLENWRVAADEFVRYLNDRGYDVVKVTDDGE